MLLFTVLGWWNECSLGEEKLFLNGRVYLFLLSKRDKRVRKVERERRMQNSWNMKGTEIKWDRSVLQDQKKQMGLKNRKYIAFLPWIPNWQFCSIFKVRCERIWESFPLTSLPGCFGNRVKKGWGKSRGAKKYLSVQKTAVFPDSHCAQRLLWYTHSSQL